MVEVFCIIGFIVVLSAIFGKKADSDPGFNYHQAHLLQQMIDLEREAQRQNERAFQVDQARAAAEMRSREDSGDVIIMKSFKDKNGTRK